MYAFAYICVRGHFGSRYAALKIPHPPTYLDKSRNFAVVASMLQRIMMNHHDEVGGNPPPGPSPNLPLVQDCISSWQPTIYSQSELLGAVHCLRR